MDGGIWAPLSPKLGHGQVCITSEDFFDVSTLPVRAVVHRSALWFAPRRHWEPGQSSQTCHAFGIGFRAGGTA